MKIKLYSKRQQLKHLYPPTLLIIFLQRPGWDDKTNTNGKDLSNGAPKLII
jgi:hypothetical protein